ncbi:MAG: hypothetical protein ACFHWX_14495 [Bacteroidota bacterium]
MGANYELLINNLRKRRFDEAKAQPITSDAFTQRGYPNALRYALESMLEIDHSYSYKVFSIAKKIQDSIASSFAKKPINVDFRYDGPIQTDTHITLFGDVTLLTLITPQTDKPWQEIQYIIREVLNLMKGLPFVTKSGFNNQHEIVVLTEKPSSRVVIQPALWLNNQNYMETKREIDRAVSEFRFGEKIKRNYMPFKNIARINAKDDRTNGGLKRMIRLLRTLQKDAESPINLEAHEISAMVYDIPERQLKYSDKQALSLLSVVSAQLTRICSDKKYFETLKAPSELEVIFGTKPKQGEVMKLKNALENLMKDVQGILKRESKDFYSEIPY